MASPAPTLVTLASLYGSETGYFPEGGLLLDSRGNLFGTANLGGAQGYGTFFEIKAGANTATPVYSFTQSNTYPENSLVPDSAGNIYGVTQLGGAGGTIYQLTISSHGTVAFQSIGTLDSSTSGSGPASGLYLDEEGNLYGTTGGGGANGDGTVFELPANSTIPVGTPFDANTVGGGSYQISALTKVGDSLYGTTYDGTLFAYTYKAATPTITTIATLPEATAGTAIVGGLVADSQGNLYGASSSGGYNGGGSIFEYVAATHTIQVLAAFDHYAGGISGSLLLDQAGNLFGETGGFNGDGTVFELKDGASAIDVLASFPINSFPIGGLIADAAGNLYGVTETGGDNGDGSIFEIENSGFVACFASGTHLRSPDGEVRVEDIRVGDVVVTTSGAHRPVKWIGHRAIDTVRHRDPKGIWPVKVQAGAFGPGKPHRDLWLSPEHAVFHDGVLVQVGRLLNGATIVQVPQDNVTYWHVELDSHDLILAEGLEAETFLDTGNRSSFVEGGRVVQLHPDFASGPRAAACLPLVDTGPALFAVKAALLRRAEALGYVWDGDHDLHIVADGVRLDADECRDGFCAFTLPVGCREVSLASRTWVPVQATAEVEDYRQLGVAVWRLRVDDVDLPLEQQSDGWHPFETDGTHFQRWTSGSVHLPSGARSVIVEHNPRGRYLRAPAALQASIAA